MRPSPERASRNVREWPSSEEVEAVASLSSTNSTTPLAILEEQNGTNFGRLRITVDDLRERKHKAGAAAEDDVEYKDDETLACSAKSVEEDEAERITIASSGFWCRKVEERERESEK